MSLAKFVPTSASKFTYNCSVSAAELYGNIQSLRGILAFPLRASDLKVHFVQDDRDVWAIAIFAIDITLTDIKSDGYKEQEANPKVSLSLYTLIYFSADGCSWEPHW